MNKYLKVEFIKEKRAANSKLMIVAPIVYVIFNLLLIFLMSRTSTDRSYLMATSFNWYPLIILPVIISLLVININNKEKNPNMDLYKRIGADSKKIFLAKNLTILMELLIILLISGLAIFLVGKYILSENIYLKEILLGNVYLFIGSLGIIGFSFLMNKLIRKNILIILINFILCLISPILAVSKLWVFYPWAYALRMLAPVLKIHPNGTFLYGNSFLMNMNDAYLGLVLSILVYLVFVGIGIFIERRKNV